jgi:hypothetical protein
VAVCGVRAATFVHFTESPTAIVSAAGVKAKLETVTFHVAARPGPAARRSKSAAIPAGNPNLFMENLLKGRAPLNPEEAARSRPCPIVRPARLVPL